MIKKYIFNPILTVGVNLSILAFRLNTSESGAAEACFLPVRSRYALPDLRLFPTKLTAKFARAFALIAS